MYCVRNSSGRQTSAAPCCAASRIRATAFARFASGSSLMLICTSPILNLSGISFMPNYNSESLARRQDESQPRHVFGLLRSRRRRRVAIESALRIRPYYGGSERDGAKWAREPDLVIRVGERGVASHILTAVVQPETHADDDIKRACEVDVARSRRGAGAETIRGSRAAVGADPAVAADRGCFHAEQVRQSVRVLRGELIVSHADVHFRRVVAVTRIDVVARAGIPVILHSEIQADLARRPAVPAIQVQLERSSVQELIAAYVRAPGADIRTDSRCVVDAPLNRGLRVGL